MKINKPTEGGESGGAFISARLRNPEAEVVATKSKQDIIGGVFAILATVVLLLVVVVLYMNFTEFRGV